MAVSKQRVYGTTVHNGLRHIATGMIDGTFSKKKGEWDTHTRCGKYTASSVDESDDLVVTCILCLGRKQPTGSILRGMTFDSVHIDEPMDFIQNDVVIDDAMNLSSEDVKNVLELYDHGALSKSYVAGTLLDPPQPSDEEPPT
jgi:hypothetical protein